MCYVICSVEHFKSLEGIEKTFRTCHTLNMALPLQKKMVRSVHVDRCRQIMSKEYNTQPGIQHSRHYHRWTIIYCKMSIRSKMLREHKNSKGKSMMKNYKIACIAYTTTYERFPSNCWITTLYFKVVHLTKSH